MKNNSYDDIINLPHPVSKNHPQMPLRDRAAQFAPFAALTGHDAAIKETARLTDERLELSEEAIAQLNEKINKEEAARIIESANHEAELTKIGARDQMKQEMVKMAVLMAGKFIQNQMDEADQNALVDQTLQEMGDKTWLQE